MRPETAMLLFAAVFVGSAGMIAAMFLSLYSQGDERRKMIVEKASTRTFAATVMYLMLSIAERIYLTLSGQQQQIRGMNPFIVLTVISVVYAAELIYHKKKYGD